MKDKEPFNMPGCLDFSVCAVLQCCVLFVKVDPLHCGALLPFQQNGLNGLNLQSVVTRFKTLALK